MTDAELTERLFARDENALELIRGRYGAYCLKIASNILPTGEDAEECVSDALLRLWNAVPPARPENLRPYLARLTRNAALTKLRSMTAGKRGGEAALVLEELAECLPAKDDVEGGFDAEELKNAVERFIRSLPAREGDMLVRRCFFTERVVDIAERYGISAHLVTVTLTRVRRRLRKYLIEEGFIDERF